MAPWLALSMVQVIAIAIYAGLFVFFARRICLVMPLRGRFWLLNVWAALAWVSVEQLRAHFPFTGFPWSKLAFSQLDGPFLAWAPWGGSVAVAFALVFVSCSIAQALLSYSDCGSFLVPPSGRIWAPVLRVALAMVGAVCVVFLPLPVFSRPPQSAAHADSLSVLAVQGNVAAEEVASAFGAPLSVTKNHFYTTQRALRPGIELDLVLWPESAVDQDPRTNGQAGWLVSTISNQAQAPILFGTLRLVDAVPVPQSYNEMILYDGTKYGDVYTKTHPVPFGEYLPWRRFFSTLFPPAAHLIGADMQAGRGPALINVTWQGNKRVTAAVPICFEVADDQLVAQAIAAGGEVLFVPSSNTFFARSSQASQQLAIARFRAAEHHRDTVAISTMAPSASIGPDGKLRTAPTLHYTADSFITHLKPRTDLTLATLLGPYLPWTVWILTGLMILTTYLRSVWSVTKSAKRRNSFE